MSRSYRDVDFIPGEDRLGTIDGLRACAILLVIAWHWLHLPSEAERHTIWSAIQIPLRLSWTGVDLFFVLSGFLIGKILMAKKGSANFFSVFYGRRAFRILPHYLVFLLVCTVFATPKFVRMFPALGWMFQMDLPLWPFYTQTQNMAMAWYGQFPNQAMSITWSLVLEEQFYLLAPVLIWKCSHSRLPQALIMMIVLGWLLRFILITVLPTSGALWCYTLLPARWDPLILGVLLAWVISDPHWRRRVMTWWKPLAVAAGLLLIAMFGPMALTGMGVIMSKPVSLWGYTVIALAYAAVFAAVLGATLSGVPQVFMLAWAPLRWIGTVSYGIYLWHECVNGFLHSVFLGHPPKMVTWEDALVSAFAFIAVLGIASGFWRCFEGPLLGFARLRFQYAARHSRVSVHV